MKKLLCSIFIILQTAAIYSKPSLSLSASIAPAISFIDDSIYSEFNASIAAGFIAKKTKDFNYGASITTSLLTASNTINRKFLPSRINTSVLIDFGFKTHDEIINITSLHLGYMHYPKINAGQLEYGITSGFYGEITKNLYIGLPISLSISKIEKRIMAELSLRYIR